jgi:hypothetical protein
MPGHEPSTQRAYSPLMLIPFEKKYDVYATRATRQLSICGYMATLECFSPSEQQRPKETPRAIETRKEKRKIPVPWKMDER